MTSPSVVRAAVPEDEAEIWRLLRLLWAENAMFPISDAKVQYHLNRFLRPKDIGSNDIGPRGMIGVIGEQGSLEGIIILAFGSQWYTETVSVDEYINFVDPEHRASNHAKALIDYAKHITDELRKEYPSLRLLIGILSTKRTAAKVRLYERRLVPAGAFFLHPAPDSIAPPQHLYRIAR